MSVLEQVLQGKEDNHILPFFWQHGEDEATLREYMNVIHNDNIGAVCIESRPHPDFCGPKWWHDMDIILEEAEKLGMKVWILDDSHFPTGYANGALDNGPEELCRESMDVQYIDVPEDTDSITIDMTKYRSAAPWAPTQIEEYIINDHFPYMRSFTEPDILSAVTAIRTGGKDAADLVDLTKEALASDTVTFTKPAAGAWKIAICHRTRNRGPHRDYINMMQSASVRVLIDTVYEQHYAHYSRYFGNVIAGFFSDEPEIGNGHLYEFGKKIGEGSDQAWSYEVEDALRTRWGEDYARFVPLIWNQDFDEDLQAKVRVQYMDAVTELVSKDFSFQIGNWCRSHGVMYIGHLIEDDHQHTRTASSLGHYFRGLAGQDMAGVDDIGGQVMPQGEGIGPGDIMHPVREGEFWHYTLGKLGGSMAALDPLKHGRAMCELFGNYGWSEGVQLEKYIADHLITKGINWFVPHAFTAAPFPDPDCPPHFYAHGNNPQYRHFGYLMKYMNRAATLLSDGRPVIPCAVLYNGESDWAGKIMYLQKVGIQLYDHQLDYLFVPNDAFTEPKYGTNVAKDLNINGKSFRAFIIPEVEYIPLAAAKAALAMAEAGGEVIFVNALPDATIENGHGDPILQKLADSAAKVVPLEKLAETLAADGIRDAVITPADNRIRIYHYDHDTDIYMVINEGTETWTGTVALPDAENACLYDAWDNALTEAATEGNQVSISLEPRKSIFIVTGKAVPTGAAGKPDTDVLSSTDWSEGWTRSFCRSIDYPAFGKTKQISLPDTLAEEEPEFSGFVRYDKTLTVPEVKKTVLTISDAREGVEVFVNGTSLGIQIVPTYRFDLTPYLKAGDNEIRIEVATTLEREAVRYPNRWAALGIPQPTVTVPTGICGTVSLLS